MKNQAPSPHQTEIQQLLAQLYCLDNNGSIVFLCNDNDVLSPFAEAYLKVLCSEVGIAWSISSAGINKISSEDQTNLSIEAAFNLGIDLSCHQKKQYHPIPPLSGKTLLFTFNNESHTNDHDDDVVVFNLCNFIPKGLGHYQKITSSAKSDAENIKHCYLLIAEALKNIFEHYRVL